MPPILFIEKHREFIVFFRNSLGSERADSRGNPATLPGFRHDAKCGELRGQTRVRSERLPTDEISPNRGVSDCGLPSEAREIAPPKRNRPFIFSPPRSDENAFFPRGSIPPDEEGIAPHSAENAMTANSGNAQSIPAGQGGSRPPHETSRAKARRFPPTSSCRKISPRPARNRVRRGIASRPGRGLFQAENDPQKSYFSGQIRRKPLFLSNPRAFSPTSRFSSTSPEIRNSRKNSHWAR